MFLNGLWFILFMVGVTYAEEAVHKSPNLLQNAGFEIATLDNLPDCWGCPHWGIMDAAAILNRRAWLENFRCVEDEAYEGKRCMRIRNMEHGPVTSGYSLISCNANSPKNTPCTLSAYMKSDTEGLPVLLAGQLVQASTEWKRVAVPFTNTGNSLYEDMVGIVVQDAGTLWIDAVQLEVGTEATPFQYCNDERQILIHDGNPEKKFFDAPEWRLPVCEEKVVIDGRLDEAVWSNIPSIPFYTLDRKTPPEKTEAYLWCNEAGIYVGARSYGGPDDFNVKERDGFYWLDPTLEMFFDSGYTRTLFHHIALSKNNIQYDDLCANKQWNGKWLSATTEAPDKSWWATEIFIPFGILNVSKNTQETWGFNIARSYRSHETFYCWAPIGSLKALYDPLRFGRLIVERSVLEGYVFQSSTPEIQWVDESHAKLKVMVSNEGNAEKEIIVTGDYDSQSARGNLRIPAHGEASIELGPYALKPEMAPYTVTVSVYEGEMLRHAAQSVCNSKPLLDAWTQYAETSDEELALFVKTSISENAMKESELHLSLEGTESVYDIPSGTFTSLISLQALPEGEHKLKVSLRNKGTGKQVAGKELSFVKLPPLESPNIVRCDRLSRMISVNGKPFMPLGFYVEGCFSGDERMAEHLAGIGCNCLGIRLGDLYERSEESARHLMDVCAENGLWVRATVSGMDRGKTSEVILAFRNHPALLAWEVYDEIFTFAAGQEHPETVKDNVAFYKQLDHAHPVFINENIYGLDFLLQKGLDFYGDLVSLDHYAWENPPNVSRYESVVERMRILASAGRRPTWMYVLGAGYAFHARRDHTPQEHRFIAYTCLIHGISGISYFADYPKSQSALDAIQTLFREFKTLTPVLANDYLDTVPVESSSPQIDFIVRQDGSELYIIAVNKSLSDIIQARFRIGTGLSSRTVEFPFEQRVLELQDGREFTDTFQPYEPHVYRLKLE